jgi:membrane-associated HD superfamily phosphohydrolase
MIILLAGSLAVPLDSPSLVIPLFVLSLILLFTYPKTNYDSEYQLKAKKMVFFTLVAYVLWFAILLAIYSI